MSTNDKTLLRTRQVAAMLGVDRTQVMRRARVRGIEPARREPISGACLWTRAQAQAIARPVQRQ